MSCLGRQGSRGFLVARTGPVTPLRLYPGVRPQTRLAGWCASATVGGRWSAWRRVRIASGSSSYMGVRSSDSMSGRMFECRSGQQEMSRGVNCWPFRAFRALRPGSVRRWQGEIACRRSGRVLRLKTGMAPPNILGRAGNGWTRAGRTLM